MSPSKRRTSAVEHATREVFEHHDAVDADFVLIAFGQKQPLMTPVEIEGERFDSTAFDSTSESPGTIRARHELISRVINARDLGFDDHLPHLVQRN